MQKQTGSKSKSKLEHDPFITIDDCVKQAQILFSGLKKLSQIKYPLDVRRGISKRVKGSMNDNTISQQLKGSGRTYFFDVEQTREGKTYLRITESRKTKADKFERNSINVYPEDASDFVQAIAKIAIIFG